MPRGHCALCYSSGRFGVAGWPGMVAGPHRRLRAFPGRDPPDRIEAWRMNHFTRSLIVLGALPLLVLVGACGGSGDDSDEDEDGESSGEATQTREGDSSGSSAAGTAASGPTTPSASGEGKTVRDGGLTGSVRIEISGDKKAKFEAKGGGIVVGGTVVLNFGDAENIVILAIGTEGDEAAGFAITTKDLSTAGEWGQSCDFRYEDSESALKGEFACKGIPAVALGTTKTYKVAVSGSFDLERR